MASNIRTNTCSLSSACISRKVSQKEFRNMTSSQKNLFAKKIGLKNGMRDLQNQYMSEIYVFTVFNLYVCLFGCVFIFENIERKEN